MPSRWVPVGGVAQRELPRGSGGCGAGPVRGRGSVLQSFCRVFSLSVSLLLLFPLFAVLLNCPYPDPPVSACFLSILLRTSVGGGAAAWCFCCRRQPKPKHHFNFCVCNFTNIVRCDFSYLTPVTSHQLLQTNYALIHDLLPVPIGMNITLVKKLLRHNDLKQLLKEAQGNGQKTLITVHHDVEEVHQVLQRAKRDGEHKWCDTFRTVANNYRTLTKCCIPLLFY